MTDLQSQGLRAIWLTDLHLNFIGRKAFEDFLETVAAAAGDCVLIGGDIGEAPDVVRYLRRIEAELRLPIYFVLGNHDFYKGSIRDVRTKIRRLAQDSTRLVWLNAEEVVSLTPTTALVGHDSWADGRLGDFEDSPVELNDFVLIEELQLFLKPDRLTKMQELAAEAAEHFERVLPRALENHNQVIVLTHVPPFRNATWHQGQISSPDWLPYFSSKIVGDVLRSVMARHPEKELTVLCGHTHGGGECKILPNLRVLTGGSEYGAPKVQQVLELA
jgi:Icc protein